MALILVRHTRPDVVEGLCYGRLDVALADTFGEEAAAVLAALPTVSRIVSSPLKRCRKLANHIAAARDLPVEIDERLMEMDFGAWEGGLWSAVKPSEYETWANDFLHARPHGGESVAMLRNRVTAAVADWSARDESIAIVTHAGVIKAACTAEGDEPWGLDPPVKFGGIIVLPDAAEQETRRLDHD